MATGSSEPSTGNDVNVHRNLRENLPGIRTSTKRKRDIDDGLDESMDKSRRIGKRERKSKFAEPDEDDETLAKVAKRLGERLGL